MPAFQLFADSFSRYNIGTFNSDAALFDNFRSRWTGASGSIGIDNNGRNGRGLQIPSGAGASKTLNHSATFTGGFALRVNGSATGNDLVLRILNNDTTLFQIFHESDGTLSIRTGTTVIGVSNRAMLSSRFYWIDYTVTFSGTTPIIATAELRINTFVECSGSGTTGVNASSLLSLDATGNVVTIGAIVGVGLTSTFSHFYIKNTAGYYGDVTFLAIFPNGDVVTGWTNSAGSTSYVLVNNHPVDLTKFISSATPGAKAIFDWDNCPGFSGTLKAINLSFLMQKDDEGTKVVKIVTGDTGTEDSSPDMYLSDITPEYYEHSQENDPATGIPYTQAGFNAKRFGVEVVS